MSEEKLKKLKALLEAAAKVGGDETEKRAKIGDLLLETAMWGGVVFKNTDDGCLVRVEV